MSASLTPAATVRVFTDSSSVTPPLVPAVCAECFTPASLGHDQCPYCLKHVCTNCNCGCKFHADPSDILEAAHQILAERFGSAYLGQPLILEDEYGCLFHHENVQALVGSQPVQYKSDFSLRLPVESQAAYRDAQLAVWGEGSFAGKSLNIGNGWSARILPLFVEDERYTVSVFTESASA